MQQYGARHALGASLTDSEPMVYVFRVMRGGGEAMKGNTCKWQHLCSKKGQGKCCTRNEGRTLQGTRRAKEHHISSRGLKSWRE